MKGFTMLEFMVLVVMVGIVAAIVIPIYQQRTDPDYVRTPNIRQIENPDAVCIKGVKYWWEYHRMAPAYSQDGTLILCEGAG